MNEQEARTAFAAKFDTKALNLAQVGGWDIALRPGQLTLGAMVVSVRSGAFTFGDLETAEQVDLAAALALAERLAKTAFGATRINLLCLMMQDPIVHFHVLPRYGAPQARFGQTWIDADWPGPPVITPCDTPADTLQQIRSALLATL